MSLLVVVPARAGSRGLPRKNLRQVGGLSLVARAVAVGRAFVARAGIPHCRILVDTDSEEIAAEGRAWGAEVPFLRPPELARDDTPTLASVIHALARIRKEGPVDQVLLLQPTSPLRTVDDVAACWDIFDPETSPSVVTVVGIPHGDLALRLRDQGRIQWLLEPPSSAHRRQLAEPVYRPNGAVYLQTTGTLEREQSFVAAGITRGHIMAAWRSIDVDDADDLVLAEACSRLAGPARPRVEAGAPRSLPPGEALPSEETVLVAAEDLMRDPTWRDRVMAGRGRVLVRVDQGRAPRALETMMGLPPDRTIFVGAGDRLHGHHALVSLGRLLGAKTGWLVDDAAVAGLALSAGFDLVVLTRGFQAGPESLEDLARRLRALPDGGGESTSRSG